MKKFYLVTVMLLCVFFANAQTKIQGVPRNDIHTPAAKQQIRNTAIDFSNIKYWVGTGSNQAGFVVQWNDSKNPDALVWGYRWDGDATGEDMLKAIAKADGRFFSLLYQGTQYGTAIGGLGFDLDGKNSNALYKDGNTTYPLYPFDGIIDTKAYDFDKFTSANAEDHWQSGWTEKGNWSYWVKNPSDTDYKYSDLGATSRVLQNGSWDVWNYSPEFNNLPISSTMTAVSEYSSVPDFTKGFFMVNEEWLGHANGSVNFVGDNGQIYYRVYSQVNNNQAFGATTQYGTIYGGKFFFISKQGKDTGDNQYTAGGRLVVADALTLKKIAGFDNIGGADGRSFVGVNEDTGYIGTSNGIVLFDIKNLKVGNMITGTEGAQIGNMVRTSKYVFAVKQRVGMLVINAETNKLINTVSGSFHSVTQAKDGSVWGIQDKKLININPVTFETTEYAIPTTQYLGSWGAWNAGSFTYSNQENALYWINSANIWVFGKQIIKFDIETKTFNENFATVPGQTDENGNPLTYKQFPYAAGLRIDPVSDRLILNTTESGFGAHYQKNWVHTFDNRGNLINTKTLNDYYWFPAITVFPDNSAPVVNSEFPSEVTLQDVVKIDLKTMVSDADNLSSAIVKSVQSNDSPTTVSAEINADDELVLTPKSMGTANIVVKFNSNGKTVEKSLKIISSSTLSTEETGKTQLKIYPNPATDVININTQDKIVSAVIYDISGKELKVNINNKQINVTALKNGLYILKIVTDKGTYNQKFIKQ